MYWIHKNKATQKQLFAFRYTNCVKQRGTDLILFVGRKKGACCTSISSRHPSNFCRVKSNLFLITEAAFERRNVAYPRDNAGLLWIQVVVWYLLSKIKTTNFNKDLTFWQAHYTGSVFETYFLGLNDVPKQIWVKGLGLCCLNSSTTELSPQMPSLQKQPYFTLMASELSAWRSLKLSPLDSIHAEINSGFNGSDEILVSHVFSSFFGSKMFYRV